MLVRLGTEEAARGQLSPSVQPRRRAPRLAGVSRGWRGQRKKLGLNFSRSGSSGRFRSRRARHRRAKAEHNGGQVRKPCLACTPAHLGILFANSLFRQTSENPVAPGACGPDRGPATAGRPGRLASPRPNRPGCRGVIGKNHSCWRGAAAYNWPEAHGTGIGNNRSPPGAFRMLKANERTEAASIGAQRTRRSASLQGGGPRSVVAEALPVAR